ncbi:TPA: hypothetical protein N0F65_004994 [Lagenidium giganteum]|uniref:SWIM-type domain-containing protein n=1 Tax=Lagenidium giganteum TaxID=4803 RepID=A0AAV2ZL29_9STRA|nr:TPA: hypothetical protein N0F65_004994 [Lagenidium giganteum]
MNYLLRWTTHYVADKISVEYLAARNKGSSYQFEDNHDGRVQGKTRNSEYEISRHPLGCTCVFASNMRLPCRHVVAYRYQMQCEHVVPIEMIDERYI